MMTDVNSTREVSVRLTMSCATLMILLACSTPRALPDSSAIVSDAPVGVTASTPPGTWSVTPTGLGDLHVGTTVAEASSAVGGTLSMPAGADTVACAFVRWADAPAGVSVMIVRGSIARVDIDSGRVATADGAAIGDAEPDLLARYGARAAVTPAKYTSGHYVTVMPRQAADSNGWLVFETDGSVVQRYRVGRRPEVQYVEKCG